MKTNLMAQASANGKAIKAPALLKKYIPLFIALALTACSSGFIEQKIKQTYVEFLQHPTYTPLTITPPVKCMKKGVEFDRATVSNYGTGTDNLLAVYVFFSNDYNDTLCVKISDYNNEEKARSTVVVSGKQDEAQLVEFRFNRDINIIPMDKLIIE